MAKTSFTRGDCVVAKRWNGTEFMGVYEYTYSDGEHCIIDTNNKHFCSHKHDVRKATEEEEKKIKQLMKQNKIIPIKEPIDEDEELKEALAAVE